MSEYSREERLVGRRDSPTLYEAMDAVYVSPVSGFDELAPTYDQRLAGNPILTLESTAVLAALPSVVDKTVVDLGCGTGRYALQLVRSGAAKVTGIDFSREMLAIAERKARRGELDIVTEWQQADIQKAIPQEAYSIGVAVCALTLSFLPEISGVFAEVARILASRGTFVVSDYHPHGLSQARAESSLQNGSKEKAPYLRFTSASGEDCRIPQYAHRISDWFSAAQSVGLVLESLTEPVADVSISNTYPALRSQIGLPLALVARFRKP